ncbi:MAG: hypothetical protein CME61_04490 [Halobacteriovoraceae bacterium]|nr:hypothetical protein [Halobacteriovoraceae bacterium]
MNNEYTRFDISERPNFTRVVAFNKQGDITPVFNIDFNSARPVIINSYMMLKLEHNKKTITELNRRVSKLNQYPLLERGNLLQILYKNFKIINGLLTVIPTEKVLQSF